MRVHFFSIFVFFCIAESVTREIAADVLELTNRVTIEGKILNPDELPRKTWQVELSKGVIVELQHKTTVGGQVTRSQAIGQYYAKAPFLPETVETHLKLAEVCMSKGLEQLGDLHYQRVLDIDQDNQTARRALNYSKVGGEWVTRDEEMTRQGYIKTNRGTWTTRQQQLISDQQSKVRQSLGQTNPVGIVQNSVDPQAQIRITDFDARRGGRD